MFSSITFKKIAEWTLGDLISEGNAEIKVTTISTDTRTLKPGDIYLAMRGEHFDGNAFIPQAVTAGAKGIICESSAPKGIPTIKVKDSLRALITIGENLRSMFKGRVFAITGSAGKSSTKDMLNILLGDLTVSSPASFNNLMGVSRTLCLVNEQTKNLVLEMGMNDFGEIAELCQRFRPQYGLITNIGDAHIGKLGGHEGIYRAKKEMFDFFAKDSQTHGLALNADDPWVMEAYKSNFQQSLDRDFVIQSYSTKEATADVFLENSSMDPQTGFLNLGIKIKGEQISISLPVFGEHHAQNIIAAMAMAQLAGVSVSEIKSRLLKIRPASHRGEIILLSQNKIVIDETYNSNPKALISALNSLKKMAPLKRKVLVLGEMRELGVFSAALHEEIATYLVDWVREKNPAMLVMTVQGDAEIISEKLRTQCPEISIIHASTVEVAKERLISLLAPEDIVFIKGSRGIKLDLLLNSLK
ncbi:MAG: UDP-N-acetylmuramoyl-tripeptide--D-alanyl-D-alanine ligase [Bdellovibrionales bacterium]|nr:UDP-N-acetylmuramoyl-tripeptide--D-alanyl-D-alanine ligase [Bdellovibrionales bacterium]